MPSKKHRPEEIIGKLREAEVVLAQGATTAEACRLSLHKSKSLSSPYVFIAGCVEGILPPAFDPKWSKAEIDAGLEESRRLP